MSIQRWNPWGDLAEMERRMDEAMRYPLTMWRQPLLWWRVPGDGMQLAVPIEMFEKEDRIVVRAEIPGMKKEDIDISVDGDVLTIKGERKSQTEVKDEDFYRCEFSYGRFSRSITLPSKVRPDKVEADYEDGVLEITLPKAAEAKPKKVAVRAKQSAK